MLRFIRLAVSAAISIILPLLFVSAASGNVRHVVEEGDTLSYLASVYSVSVGDIVSLNNITNPDLIFPGQELIFPGGDGSPAPSPSGSVSSETYTIQPGDTLSAIAAKFDVTIGVIQQANGIDDPGLIIAGHTLTVPQPADDPAPPPLPKLQFPPQPDDPQIESLIEQMSAENGVPANLVKAMATVESGWREGAVSSTGARGVMQIMPGTAEWLETQVFGMQLNEDTSVYDNIKMGTKYLSLLLDSTGGNDHLAVAAYYQGLAPTQSGVFYPDTADYVDMIFRVRDAYWPG